MSLGGQGGRCDCDPVSLGSHPLLKQVSETPKKRSTWSRYFLPGPCQCSEQLPTMEELMQSEQDIDQSDGATSAVVMKCPRNHALEIVHISSWKLVKITH